MKLERLLCSNAAVCMAQHNLHYHFCCLFIVPIGTIWISGKCMLKAGRLAYNREPSVRRETEVEIFQWQSDQLLALIGLQHRLRELDAAKEQGVSHIYQYFAYLHGREVLDVQRCAAIRLQ